MPQKKRNVAVAERFGVNLRRVRRRADLSREQLAQRVGLHRTEVGRLEKGERVPRVDTVVRLADSASARPAELLDGIYWIPSPEASGTFPFSSRPDPDREEEPFRWLDN
jgi:transcriptional regulator with XRE-family HTH domain